MADLSKFKPKLVTNQPDETKEFLKHFQGNLCVTVSPSFKSYINPTDEEWAEIVAVNKSGSDVFFTVNETSQQGRKMSDIVRLRAVFADDDQPRKSPQDFPLPPSLIVETSHHDDGHKYHYYWLINEPMERHDEWRAVEESIIINYGADIAAKDSARLLRLPGFNNNKYEDPKQCRTVRASGQIYDWATITASFPPVEQVQRHELEGKDADGEFNVYELEKRFRYPDESGWISNSANSIVMHMAQHNYSEGKILRRMEQLFDTIPEESLSLHSNRYYEARVQLKKWIKSAKDKVNKERIENVVVQMPKPARPLKSQDMVDFSPIPKECVPDAVYRAASAVGDFLANGVEPSIISAFSITCAVLAKNVRINEIGESKQTYCSSGIVVAMESGTRKTEVYKLMNKPFLDYEKLLQQQWESEKHITQSLEMMYREQLKSLESEYKKNIKKGLSENEMMAFAQKMAKVRADIEEQQVAKPNLHIKDVTEEAVIPKMAENKGMLAVVSDDSRNIIKNVLGRYSKDSTAEGWIIDGIGGTTIKYNRSKDSGTEVVIDEPCLNLYLMVQPDMAIKFKDHEVYRHSGLAARVPVYFYPVDPLDIVRKSDRTKQLDEHAMDEYYRVLRELCVARQSEPMMVDLSQAAVERFNKFNKRFLHLLETTWQGEYSKTNKIVTQAVIMSTVIAAMDDQHFRDALRSKPEMGEKYILDIKHANMGCMYVEALYEGMVKSTTSLDNISTSEVAVRFAKSLLKAYEQGKIWEGFKASSYIQQRFKMVTAENMHAILDMLSDHGWLNTTVAEEQGSLNKGWPGGKIYKGDAIYHLNVNEVKKFLRMHDDAERAKEAAKYE